MIELEDMKGLWKSQKVEKKYTREDLKKLSQKKSSSIVRWIFILSIIEFIFWTLLSYTNIFVKSTTEIMDRMSIGMKLIGYLQLFINLGFIYLFYKNYRSLSISESIKSLMKQILRIRKVVKYYVGFNILFFIIGFIEGAYLALLFESEDTGVPIHFTTNKVLVIFGSILILALFLWGFYTLIYGRLLNSLNKNYKEIQTIDFEN